MNPTPAVVTALLLGACAGGTQVQSPAERLVGTWETTDAIDARVTYEPDGTWRSVIFGEVDGEVREYRGAGTWKVEDGAIHNTTLSHDEIPGMPPIELPYLSVEKLVEVGDREYRYVCPVQQCTNTMRRVDG